MEEFLNLIGEKKRNKSRKLEDIVKEIGNKPKEKSGKLWRKMFQKRECSIVTDGIKGAKVSTLTYKMDYLQMNVVYVYVYKTILIILLKR